MKKSHLLILISIITIGFGIQYSNKTPSIDAGNLISGNKEGDQNLMIEGKEFYKIGRAGDYWLYKRKGDFVTAQALEFIYEDKKAKYYFRSMESGLYRLVKGDEVLRIKPALKEGKITIDDLYLLESRIYIEEKMV